MVQETSASTTLPHQSRAGAFPNLGGRCNWAHIKRYRPAELPQAHNISIAPLPETLLKRKRPHLKEDSLRDIASACLTLFRSQFLPPSGPGIFGETVCALLPTGITEGHGNAEGWSAQAWSGHGPASCGMKDSSHREGAFHSPSCTNHSNQAELWPTGSRPLGIPYVGHEQHLLPFSAISEDVLHSVLCLGTTVSSTAEGCEWYSFNDIIFLLPVIYLARVEANY